MQPIHVSYWYASKFEGGESPPSPEVRKRRNPMQRLAKYEFQNTMLTYMCQAPQIHAGSLGL
jgi:hypothetical protein